MSPETIRDPYLEIRFRPTIATVNEARRLVAALYEPLLADADAASRIALATHELLENAIKYSVDGATVIRVALSRERPPTRVIVETRNGLSPQRKEGLEEVFEEMERAGDPEVFYRGAIQRTRHQRQGSGLGLARVWAEGEMAITRTYDGDEVCIRAVASVPEVR